VWINSYFANPDAFAKPDAYVLNNAPRATGLVRSPKAINANLSAEKEFSLAYVHQGMKLELRLEAQNAFNHPIFGTPDTIVDDDNFGIINYTSNAARQVQLGMKVTF
jgi:hypothetical protein